MFASACVQQFVLFYSALAMTTMIMTSICLSVSQIVRDEVIFFPRIH